MEKHLNHSLRKRGFRQGHPFSVYLFVLGMKSLGQAINKVIRDGYQKVMKASRNGPNISHFFFADNLILFGEASIKKEIRMVDILRDFYDYSGHKINIMKSKMFVSRNIDPHTINILHQSF